MTSRIAKWDNIKFMLIICVVFGHMSNVHPLVTSSYSRLQFWIYLFHMPAFLFISGLFSQRTVSGKNWYKAVSFLLLFYFMKLIDFCVSVVLVGIHNSSIDLWHENGVPWYALAMFWCYLVTILVQKKHPVCVLVISVLLAVVSGYRENLGSFLVIRRSLIFFPFFYAGYLTDIEKLQTFLNQVYVRIGAVVILICSFVFVRKYYDGIAGFKRLFQGRYAYGQIDVLNDDILAGTSRIAAYVISFIMIFAIFSIVPSKRIFPAWLCTNTLSVFVFHKAVLNLAIHKFPVVANWLAGHYLCNAFIMALAVAVFTSLPVFAVPLKKMMKLPYRKKGAKPEA